MSCYPTHSHTQGDLHQTTEGPVFTVTAALLTTAGREHQGQPACMMRTKDDIYDLH